MSMATAGNSDRVDPYVLKIAITIVIGALAVVFDTTIMSVAINDLGRDLHAPLSTIQWVTTGYLLALSVTMPIAGWAQSALGGKRLWILSLGIFLIGSVLSASAWNAPSLIVFRVVQGIGGGLLMTLAATLIMQAARGRNIGKVMALIMVPTALGPVLGPVLGGIILHFGHWRWLFFINIPFCVVGGWLAWRNLPADGPVRRQPLDVAGLLLICPGVAALVYGLSQVDGASGFTSARVLAPLLAGVVLVAAFTVWALRRKSRALVDMRLLRHRPLASSSALLLLAGAALYGTMLLLPLYFQQVRGQTALGAGLLLIPQGIGTLLSRSLAGKFNDKYGPRIVALIAFIIACAATLPFAFVTASTNYIWLMAVLLVRGIGLGAVMIPLGGSGFSGLSQDEMPHASILIRTTQQLGGSIGTALLIVILQNAVAGASTPGALAAGFRAAFWWAVIFTAIAVPVCLLLPGRPEPAQAESSEAPPEAGQTSERAAA
jgi:EmrB/QacA subfamily drug resistance transporter